MGPHLSFLLLPVFFLKIAHCCSSRVGLRRLLRRRYLQARSCSEALLGHSGLCRRCSLWRRSCSTGLPIPPRSGSLVLLLALLGPSLAFFGLRLLLSFTRFGCALPARACFHIWTRESLPALRGIEEIADNHEAAIRAKSCSSDGSLISNYKGSGSRTTEGQSGSPGAVSAALILD